MQYKTILFDLDGTLTDSAHGILNSVRYGCRRIGIPVPDEATLRRFLGPPLIDSFHNLCGLNDADTDRAVAAFREYFPDKGLFENEVYPGIPALLADLHARGCQLVLATSKPEEYARRIMEHSLPPAGPPCKAAEQHRKIRRTGCRFRKNRYTGAWPEPDRYR